MTPSDNNMGCGNTKCVDTTNLDLETLNNIKGHFEDMWAPGKLHVNTIWKTVLIVILLEVGGLGVFKLVKWYMRKRAARKATRAKAVWDQWHVEQARKTHVPAPAINPAHQTTTPSAPPFPEGGPRRLDWETARDRAILEEWSQWRAGQEDQARQRGPGDSRVQYHRALLHGLPLGAPSQGPANQGASRAVPQPGASGAPGVRHPTECSNESEHDINITLQQGIRDDQ